MRTNYTNISIIGIHSYICIESMLCPTCNHQLLPLNIAAKVRQITVEYCGHCGGVWTDGGDINFLETSDVATFDYYLPKHPYYLSNESLLCPKDRSILEIFRGESVPPDLTIYACPKCSGYFFPFKKITIFKKAQAAKVNYFKTWHIPLPSIYSVVLPVLALLAIGTLAVTFFETRHAQDVRTRARDTISQPLISQPTQNQVFISFTTNQPTTTKIRYWQVENMKLEQTISEKMLTTHSIMLSNLEIGTTYFFEVVVTTPEELTSETYSFTTGN